MKNGLKIVEFGEAGLRRKAREVKVDKIKIDSFQKLIRDMSRFLLEKKLGVGLAAPQVGRDLSLAVIRIRPSKRRPDVKKSDLTIINPKISKTFGNRSQLWEGCISGGGLKNSLFAKVPRYKKIELSYRDNAGKTCRRTFEGLIAHVIQHEVDHLNGVLFVDRVKDTKTYASYSQYIKMVKGGKAS